LQYSDISALYSKKYSIEFGLIPTDPEFVEDEEEMSLELHPDNCLDRRTFIISQLFQLKK